ncbi:MAG TPA: NAD(P)-dependent alcohol dehydrogenase [Alphaproteobacteria bacterium]|nr:NAD(P)-dependent alcohol dehydrogenase [Alphaproteobacteria bacterium]
MTATMKAFRLTEWAKPPRLVEVPVPKPERGQILVKVGGAGLCHSDIGMMAMPEAAGRMAGWNMPFTLGHEVGGWVAEAGDGLKGVAPGDPVVLVSAYSCGHCQFCLSGHDNSCVETYAGRGYGRDGGLAEYVLVDSPRAVIKLTSLDPRDAGPLSDAGATAYHAVKRVLPKLTPGSTAAVIGAGGLGMFAIQFLRVMSPAKIIAVDQNPNRLALALASGAHEAVTGVDTFTSAAIKEHSGGIGAEAVLDFVGNDASLEQGLAAVRSVGSFALVGAGGGTLNRNLWSYLPKDGELFTFQGGSIRDLREVIALVEAGLVKNETERFPFSQVEEAYRRLDEGKLRGRAVVTPDIWE